MTTEPGECECGYSFNGSRCEKPAHHLGIHYAQTSSQSAVAWSDLPPTEGVRNGN